MRVIGRVIGLSVGVISVIIGYLLGLLPTWFHIGLATLFIPMSMKIFEAICMRLAEYSQQ